MNKQEEKDINEVIEETPKSLPEAPISVTIQSYYKGFSVLITKRDPDVEAKPLIKQSIDAIDYLIKLGFKPSWNTATNEEYANKPTNKQLNVPTPESPEGLDEDGFPLSDNPSRGDISICPIHKVKMKQMKGRWGIFYSHGRKLQDGSWDNCNSKGFKSELNQY